MPADLAFELSAEERAALLSLARRSIETAFAGKDAPEPSGGGGLDAACGAFVSLHIGPRLRGCVGRLSSALPLVETVALMARAAAFEDPRFPPLSREELPKVRLEISVLSPLEAVGSIEEIRVGRHGLLLEKSGRSGVLLPQVPGEFGWDRETFLEQLCHKAGLRPGAWAEAGARLSRFEALVFSEKAYPWFSPWHGVPG